MSGRSHPPCRCGSPAPVLGVVRGCVGLQGWVGNPQHVDARRVRAAVSRIAPPSPGPSAVQACCSLVRPGAPDRPDRSRRRRSPDLWPQPRSYLPHELGAFAVSARLGLLRCRAPSSESGAHHLSRCQVHADNQRLPPRRGEVPAPRRSDILACDAGIREKGRHYSRSGAPGLYRLYLIVSQAWCRMSLTGRTRPAVGPGVSKAGGEVGRGTFPCRDWTWAPAQPA